jgi:hypothetical protein
MRTTWNRDKITRALQMTPSIILPGHPARIDVGELHDKNSQRET